MSTAKIILIVFFYLNSAVALFNTLKAKREGLFNGRWCRARIITILIELVLVSVLFYFSGIFNIKG